jgi:ATP-dependent RNA helicase DDX46/PRP5
LIAQRHTVKLMTADPDAAERKRKRLEAWRKRQEEKEAGGFHTTALDAAASSTSGPAVSEAPKVKIGLGLANIKRKKKKRANFAVEEKEDDEKAASSLPLLMVDELGSSAAAVINGSSAPTAQPAAPPAVNTSSLTTEEKEPSSKRRRRGRWDLKDEDEPQQPKPESATSAAETSQPTPMEEDGVNDALDAFMMKLEAGSAADQDEEAPQGTQKTTKFQFNIDSSGSMIKLSRSKHHPSNTTNNKLSISKTIDYTHSDWESDAPATPYAPDELSEAETDDEEEENARRAFIEALKKTKAPPPKDEIDQLQDVDDYETKSEVKSEKERREDALKSLEREASSVRKSAHVAIETGRMYNDEEGGVMEEAERTLAALNAAPDALEVLAEMNKKKELRAVDHGSVEYLPIRKNLYIVPPALAKLTSIEVAERRAKLNVKVRGKGAPAPVSTFHEAGLSERITSILDSKGIVEPFPVQAQCLPCIMAGRDVIGIAKTGSGKTLAFVLPMLRHILDQPPLQPGETGPIGLIIAPARELAYQIHVVCKGLAKHLGLKSTAVYGGAEVREQIGDLKRGTHILCATPGRLIDILTMQSGKLISLQRVSFVCCDESDRAFDMGFEPQITAILSAVRPDRQTVLFSATFPKTVENLAKKSLRAPLEIIVGGRSVASDSVEQYAEVVEEQDKFLRLLQLLGEHTDDGKKAIVFVGKQDQADSIFEQLTRCGYSSLSIHGGMDQEDRNSNMSDFKRADGPSILVATSVAGRGLDVPSCGCVINYSAPNHYEDYVHRVGRTGRAGNVGIAYTFVNSTEEAKFAPSVVRAIVEAGQSKNVSQELKDLAESFKAKVAKGEAKWASSGYKGKGYTYDSSEMNEAQKLAKLEKRQALIEAGLLDPDDDNDDAGEPDDDDEGFDGGKPAAEAPNKEQQVQSAVGLLANVSSDMLAIPGMREALMRKAGMLPTESATMTSTGSNHFVEELEINDYPQQARWKVTQKDTTSRLQDEFQTAVTLKGQYIEPGKTPAEGERKLYLHLEAQSSMILQNCIVEIKRLLNEETLKVGARSLGGGGRYNVLS